MLYLYALYHELLTKHLELAVTAGKLGDTHLYFLFCVNSSHSVSLCWSQQTLQSSSASCTDDFTGCAGLETPSTRLLPCHWEKKQKDPIYLHFCCHYSTEASSQYFEAMVRNPAAFLPELSPAPALPLTSLTGAAGKELS